MYGLGWFGTCVCFVLVLQVDSGVIVYLFGLQEAQTHTPIRTTHIPNQLINSQSDESGGIGHCYLFGLLEFKYKNSTLLYPNTLLH